MCVLNNRAYLFGGRDTLGAASHLLYTCPCYHKSEGVPRWRLVDCEESPLPRWGHSMLVWGEQMWVIGGENSSMEDMADIHRLNPNSRVWKEVPQRGEIPDRSFGRSPFRSFHHVVAHESTMLAFGLVQDFRGSKSNDDMVALYAFDFCSGEWSRVRTSGSLSIDHLLGLVVYGDRLHAIGWEGKSPNEGVQVWGLRLVEHGLHWENIGTKGCKPDARRDCQVTFLASESRVVLHGGLTTMAGSINVSDDVFVLSLESTTWEKLHFDRDSCERARHQHCAAYVPCSSSVMYSGGSSQPRPNAGCLATEIMHIPSRPDASPISPPLHLPRYSMGPHRSHRFNKYCCMEAMSDITLVAGGKPFPAHRIVLATASPNFYQLLENAPHTKHDQVSWSRVVEMNDLSADVMECVLKHIYGCLPIVPHHLAADLFSASDRYGIKGLRTACLSVLASVLTVENIASCALLANEHKCEEMMEACISLASESSVHLASVFGSPGYLKLNRVCPELSQKFTKIATERLLQKLQGSSDTGGKCTIAPMPYVGREVVMPGVKEKRSATIQAQKLSHSNI
ncbi:hypothetical protein BSKO_04428 [Bryopsis sp. KO-2023]|nr:hypothetical protein BSKO_04428 [Bryopsis sp. KO-2023]